VDEGLAKEELGGHAFKALGVWDEQECGSGMGWVGESVIVICFNLSFGLETARHLTGGSGAIPREEKRVFFWCWFSLSHCMLTTEIGGVDAGMTFGGVDHAMLCHGLEKVARRVLQQTADLRRDLASVDRK